MADSEEKNETVNQYLNNENDDIEVDSSSVNTTITQEFQNDSIEVEDFDSSVTIDDILASEESDDSVENITEITSQNNKIKEGEKEEMCLDRSRSASIETCIERNSLDESSIESVEEPIADESLLAKFSEGARVGLFASTPLYTCIGFEVKEALGSFKGIMGALLGATASAIICGIISSLASNLSKTNQKAIEPKQEVIEIKNKDVKKTSHKTDLTEEDIQFIMSNTDFSREHVEKWFATFKKQCPNCLLDKSSFIDFYKNLIPGNSEVKDEFAEVVFQAFDADNNGYVDFGEFLIAFWIKAKGSLKSKLEWLFEVYDFDKSGYISLKELTNMLSLVLCLKNINEDPIERAEYIMRLVDIDSDSHLSKTEFVSGCLKDEKLRELLET